MTPARRRSSTCTIPIKKKDSLRLRLVLDGDAFDIGFFVIAGVSMSIDDSGDDRLCYSRTMVATCSPQSNKDTVRRQAHELKFYDSAPRACEIEGLQIARDSFCERLQSDPERSMEPYRESSRKRVATAKPCLVGSVRGHAAAPIES